MRAISPATARMLSRFCWERGKGSSSSGDEVPFVEEGFPFGEVVGSAEDGFEHGQSVDAGSGDVDEDAVGGWGEEVEDGHVEGPGEGDEVVGGELADPVAGDGAFGVGDHGFGPFFAGDGGEEAGDFALGEAAAVVVAG